MCSILHNFSVKRRSWKDVDLKIAVLASLSVRQVLVRLGLRAAGGNYEQVKKSIRELNLDTSHFKGRAWNRGLRGIVNSPRISLDKILVRNSNFQSFKLKNRLFREKLKSQQCEECGWAVRSQDGRLPLELDHINGDRHDNRLENLRILCPNCHSLKPTHRGKNSHVLARVVEW